MAIAIPSGRQLLRLGAVLVSLNGNALCADPTSQARALIGIDFPTQMLGELIPGSECTDDGGGALEAEGRELKGWSLGVATCSKRFVYLLKRFQGYEDGNPKWHIVETLLLPPLKHGLQNYDMAECSLDGRFDTVFIALARLGRRDRVDHRTGVVAAWSIDTAAGKFVPISTKRVVCYRPTPP